jgi:oligoribonuclease
MFDKNNLVWMDLEMTGLDPERDKILELAVIITDSNLNIIAEGPTIAIYQNENDLALMDNWNRTTHTNSGLLDRVRASEDTEFTCMNTVISFMQQYVPMGASPLCGNSIWQDRRFIIKHLPYIDRYLHYRNIDVSSIKELVRRWDPSAEFKKEKRHEALADIRESIDELKFYRANFFKL